MRAHRDDHHRKRTSAADPLRGRHATAKRAIARSSRRRYPMRFPGAPTTRRYSNPEGRDAATNDRHYPELLSKMTNMMTMMTMTTTTTPNGGDDIPTNAINEAFYRAAMNENTILMNKLLNRGADVNHVDKTTGYTALLAAVRSKLVRAVQFLLEKGADPAAHDSSGWTCIHLAVHHGYPVRILTAMLDNGRSGGAQRLVDWRTRDLLQETALHMAAKRGDCAATLALIRAGARVNPPDRRRRTPLLVALHGRRDDVARLLVYAGADVNNGRGQPGQTSPLRVAVARENTAMVRFLLERGAVVVDPRTDDLDWTVVHAACESGDVDTLELLLTYAGPAALAAMHDGGRPQPPLLVAASMGHGRAVRALLARGVDVNVRRANGETALHAAARAANGGAVLVDRLLDAGALVDARDALAGHRPLDVAVHAWGRQATGTAHLVHAHRLAKAVARHDVDAVAFLLACGVTPNAATGAHGTPLHAAVRHRRYRMMAAVLASDRCRTDVRHNGVTALDHALAVGDGRAARMILWRRACRYHRRVRHTSLSPPPPPPPAVHKRTAEPRGPPNHRYHHRRRSATIATTRTRRMSI